jgi:hypothetical protein
MKLNLGNRGRWCKNAPSGVYIRSLVTAGRITNRVFIWRARVSRADASETQVLCFFLLKKETVLLFCFITKGENGAKIPQYYGAELLRVERGRTEVVGESQRERRNP